MKLDIRKSSLHHGVLVVIYFLFEELGGETAYAVLCEDWRILVSDIAMLSDSLAEQSPWSTSMQCPATINIFCRFVAGECLHKPDYQLIGELANHAD